jgi:hypothetical protein
MEFYETYSRRHLRQLRRIHNEVTGRNYFRLMIHLRDRACQELAYSRVAESSQGLLLWLDQSFTLYLSHPTIINIITIVPPITACASSYDYQLLLQTHNLDRAAGRLAQAQRLQLLPFLSTR